MAITIRLLEDAVEMEAVEELQRTIWPGSDTDVVPVHILLTFAHNGGLMIGAYDEDKLVGFVFGFPGIGDENGRGRIKHCSHQLGVLPEYRSQGVGFMLKRAQWQMVRKQGLSWITWTYDPLLSTNAYLNIAKLGAVCSTYKREVYGEMRDGLNAGLPSDRFQVDWWLDSARVRRRLSKKPRQKLDLAHYLDAGVPQINPTTLDEDHWPEPAEERWQIPEGDEDLDALLLMEIPADFQSLRSAKRDLAYAWRMHSRDLFERLFANQYLVTDFIYLEGKHARSFYVLSRGDITLGT